VQGPPDQLLCDPADNGGFLISGSCVLPDAVIGLPCQGHLLTSHKAVGGTAADPGVEPGRRRRGMTGPPALGIVSRWWLRSRPTP
jgi:hypothetical protein